ncbi:hypothetical protein HPP92_023977 [Vanilla planifolia]|uniref:Cytokinin dehydrogenase 1 FAD/cytokinin binding domain-containing protein n=1 Tax=Vanilla planifolia TaxID=51239 RepID=A0A835PIV1_VANPL|nr:hypothetical protein HPP92_023977 [Vanilla planifolia]
MGPILVYPTNRTKWDERMIAVTPEEEVFYSVGLLHYLQRRMTWCSWRSRMLRYCSSVRQNGIKFKLYLPVYRRREKNGRSTSVESGRDLRR